MICISSLLAPVSLPPWGPTPWALRRLAPVSPGPALVFHALARHEPLLARPRGALAFLRRCPQIDRKSTRLNSSHSQISYAVFCLKKKQQYASRRTPGRFGPQASRELRRNHAIAF